MWNLAALHPSTSLPPRADSCTQIILFSPIVNRMYKGAIDVAKQEIGNNGSLKEVRKPENNYKQIRNKKPETRNGLIEKL